MYVQTVSTNIYLTNGEFVIIPLVIETFRQGCKLELSSSHSSVNRFGGMSVSILQ